MKKLLSVVLILGLGLSITGASCGGGTTAVEVKHNAALTIVTVEAALALVHETEDALRCGRPAAPATFCIDRAKHDSLFKPRLIQGFTYVGQARDLYAADDATNPEVQRLVTLVAGLVKAILVDLPDSSQKVALLKTPQVSAVAGAR